MGKTASTRRRDAKAAHGRLDDFLGDRATCVDRLQEFVGILLEEEVMVEKKEEATVADSEEEIQFSLERCTPNQKKNLYRRHRILRRRWYHR